MATALSVNEDIASTQMALDMYSFDNNMEKATNNKPTFGYPAKILVWYKQ